MGKENLCLREPCGPGPRPGPHELTIFGWTEFHRIGNLFDHLDGIHITAIIIICWRNDAQVTVTAGRNTEAAIQGRIINVDPHSRPDRAAEKNADRDGRVIDLRIGRDAGVEGDTAAKGKCRVPGSAIGTDLEGDEVHLNARVRSSFVEYEIPAAIAVCADR